MTTNENGFDTQQGSDVEPLVNGAEEAPPRRDEAHLLRMFIGPNADPFLKIYGRYRPNKHFAWAGWAGFNVTACFFSLFWLFYRKLYLEGAILVAVPVVLAFLFPEAMAKVQISAAGLFLLYANNYYVQRSLWKIRKIEERSLPESERDAIIAKSGGTSGAGAALGGAITAAFFIIAVFDALPQEMAACDSEVAQKTVRQMVLKHVQAKGIPADNVTFSKFGPTKDATKDLRFCKFAIGDVQGEAEIPFTIEWADAGKTTVNVTINPARR